MERDKSSITKQYQSTAEDSRFLFEKLYWILMRNTIPADNINISDLTDEELKDAVLEWRQLLSPLWKKFKKALFDYKKNILPAREKLTSGNIAPADPSSPLYEYKDLQDNSYIPRDKIYAFKLAKASTAINISFDMGKVSIFRGNLNAVNSFIDLIKDVPIDLFSTCAHCKKMIIVSRKGKRYHYHCAAKAIQKALWKKDPEGARERERIRYAKKRKPKRTLKKEIINGEES